MKIYSYFDLLKKISEITEIPGYIKGSYSLTESGIFSSSTFFCNRLE